MFVSPNGGTITAMEGYSILTVGALIQITPLMLSCFDCSPAVILLLLIREDVWNYLRLVNQNHGLIAGICAGVEILEHACLLDGIDSTHSTRSGCCSLR